MDAARDFLAGEHVDVVIHHSPCDDGHAAAALFYHRNPTVILHGLHPKDELLTPETRAMIQGKNVVFVDIAFSRDVMTEAATIARKIVILDHHITNQTALENFALPNLRTVFVMDFAGCCLAWRFLHEGEAIPAPIWFIGLKDVWRHENVPQALYFTTAFVRPISWEGWIPYLTDPSLTERTIEQGRVIYEYQRSVLKTMMEKVEYTTWRGYRMAIVNVPFPWISDIGAMMCETEPDRTIAVVWNKPVTGPFSVSLRTHNPDGPDVAQIAQEFKGGGHKHGAGLRLQQPPWEIFVDK